MALDLEKVSIGFYADGGTAVLSTIVDLTTLSKEMCDFLISHDDAYTLIRKSINREDGIHENLRCIQLTIPKNETQIYYKYHELNMLLIDSLDQSLIYTIFKRLLNSTNTYKNEKYGIKHYNKGLQHHELWISRFRLIVRDYKIIEDLGI